MNTTDKIMALANTYADSNGKALLEKLYGTSQSYTEQCEAEAFKNREALLAEIEALVRERDELKKQNKLYAGMLVYGSEVVFPRGDETTDEEALAAIDAKSAEINQAAMQEKQS